MTLIPSLRPETRYGLPMADQILFNREYLVGYSYLLRQPRWTLEIINPESEVINIEDRMDTFRTDLRIPIQFRADLVDFKNSGYDRGHLVPSANRRSSQLINSETFLLSNMSPQHPSLNRKIWAELEKKVRGLRIKKGIVEVYVLSGPLFNVGSKIEVIGENNEDPNDIIIPIPHAFFKCILAENVKGKIHLWAFAIPNKETSPLFSHYQRPTTYIEKWSGISIWNRLQGIEKLKKRKPKLWFSEKSN